ncbi:hypothetical protein N803_06360 [Knoellia subterranea KCTC 19937]|uniref:Uncharacterized protein n=1 Tax=Knoellia subterranea KCTC 19937 TaxID=1385521 RepID=A0A0A0JFY4_9MICO|nr:hypothetical protein N803_06360 [Knoellia subterranea KCTC 19937]
MEAHDERVGLSVEKKGFQRECRRKFALVPRCTRKWARFELHDVIDIADRDQSS